MKSGVRRSRSPLLSLSGALGVSAVNVKGFPRRQAGEEAYSRS
jgi:hypothetical protein